MRPLELGKAFTLIEPGPVVLVTTHDGKKGNVMTISWTMVLDFTPLLAITTGEWNYSFRALRRKSCSKALPPVSILAARRGAPSTPWVTARSSSTAAGWIEGG